MNLSDVEEDLANIRGRNHTLVLCIELVHSLVKSDCDHVQPIYVAVESAGQREGGQRESEKNSAMNSTHHVVMFMNTLT